MTYSRNLFRSSLVAFSVLFLFVMITEAQAVKVDEFEENGCEDERSRVDNLLVELNESPSSKGVIVFHPAYHDPILAYKQKSSITAHLKFRMFEADRVIFVLGKSEPNFRTELWKVSQNELSQFSGAVWDFKLTELTYPVIVNAESWFHGANCGFYASDLKFYSEFLNANSNLLGRVIIRERSVGRFRTIRTRIVKELTTKFRVSNSKLEFAFIQDDSADIEYWYIPRDLFPSTTMR